VTVEHALDVAVVQRPHDTDPRIHQEVAAFGGTDQEGNGRLPFRKAGAFMRSQESGTEHSILGVFPLFRRIGFTEWPHENQTLTKFRG
jgi:hypothetical protein